MDDCREAPTLRGEITLEADISISFSFESSRGREHPIVRIRIFVNILATYVLFSLRCCNNNFLQKKDILNLMEIGDNNHPL